MYEPGDHVCSPDSGFLDTSGTKTEPGDINNLKLFVTDDRDAFYNMQINEGCLKGSCGKCQGLVGMRTLKRDLFVHIVGFLTDTYDGSWTKTNLEDLISEVDRMTVLIDEVAGQLVDIYLFDGSDEHKEDDRLEKKSKAVAGEDGTYSRACVSFPLPLD